MLRLKRIPVVLCLLSPLRKSLLLLGAFLHSTIFYLPINFLPFLPPPTEGNLIKKQHKRRKEKKKVFPSMRNLIFVSFSSPQLLIASGFFEENEIKFNLCKVNRQNFSIFSNIFSSSYPASRLIRRWKIQFTFKLCINLECVFSFWYRFHVMQKTLFFASTRPVLGYKRKLRKLFPSTRLATGKKFISKC